MSDLILRRPLTDLETKLRDDHRCIVCGVKVAAKGVRGPHSKSIYPLECGDCRQSRTQCCANDKHGYGAAHASVFHESMRVLGYSNAAGGGPCLDPNDERNGK